MSQKTHDICFFQSLFQPLVSSPSGSYLGKTVRDPDSKSDLFHFLGVRYAQPPVGELRFRDPAPLRRNGYQNGYQNATAFGQDCPQKRGGPVRGAEDCLFLNVFTPQAASSYR